MLGLDVSTAPLDSKPSTAVGARRLPPRADGTVNFRRNLEGIKGRVNDLARKYEDG